MRHTHKDRYRATLDKVQQRMPKPKFRPPAETTVKYDTDGRISGFGVSMVWYDELSGGKQDPAISSMAQRMVDLSAQRTEEILAQQRREYEAARAQELAAQEAARLNRAYGAEVW